MGLIGIKAAKNDFNAAIAKIVRKYRDMSLSEIKKIVLEGNYLYECDYVDEQGIKVILSINSCFFLRTFFLLLVSPMRYHLYYIIGAST